ncbi:MAG: GTPase ObgE, partial [Aerococcus viridans]
ISAYTREGLDPLMDHTAELIRLEEERIAEEGKQASTETVIYEIPEDEEPPFYVGRESDGTFYLYGDKIEKTFKMANLEYDESALRFARQLKNMGVDKALAARGAKQGDIIRILDYEFEFQV